MEIQEFKEKVEKIKDEEKGKIIYEDFYTIDEGKTLAANLVIQKVGIIVITNILAYDNNFFVSTANANVEMLAAIKKAKINDLELDL